MTLAEQIAKAGAAVPGSLLEDVVSRVVATADPERIVLFGSAARGTIGPHSDLDLLVIKGGRYDYHRLICDLYAAVADVQWEVEIVLATPEQVERYRDSFCLVYYPALREGKVLYDRGALGS